MTVSELNTLRTVCELERTQLLTILALSDKVFQLAGFLLTQNQSNFLHEEGSTPWLYDCPHHFAPLYIAEKCYDKIPNNYLDTVKYVDLITRQTFDYATPIPWENNPKNIIALDPDTDQYYILTPKSIKRDPLFLFESRRFQTAISPNTFTAQDAGIYSKQALKHFWDRILFAKHNTLQLLGKAIIYEFKSQTDTLPFNPKLHNLYNTLRIGLSDYILNIAPFLDTGWFKSMFIQTFSYPEYILTQCGSYFSTALFLNFIFKTIVNAFKTFNAKTLIKGQNTFMSALSQRLLGTVSKSMINAVQYDNDSDDDNTNTNPTKVKTTPSKKLPPITYQLNFHTFRKFRNPKERTLN